MARQHSAQRTLQSVDVVRNVMRRARNLRSSMDRWRAKPSVDIANMSDDECLLLGSIIGGARLLLDAALELHVPDEAT